MNTTTTYLGLPLPHPFIAGASPLSQRIDTLRQLEDAGCAAVVLHSLFEEQVADARACQALFDQFVRGELRSPATGRVADLRWYFSTRRAIDANDLDALSVTQIDRFHAARRQFAGPLMESLYAEWLADGDVVLGRLERGTPVTVPTPGRLLVRTLPYTYTQFGALPGVA